MAAGYSAAISACEVGGHWTFALALLTAMLTARLAANKSPDSDVVMKTSGMAGMGGKLQLLIGGGHVFK